MPATRPNLHPNSSSESTRTAIIVCVVISVLVLIALVLFFRGRYIRKSAKAGTRIDTSSSSRNASPTLQRHDKGLEVGVVKEPVPVYRRELGEDEKRLDGGVGRLGSETDGVR